MKTLLPLITICFGVLSCAGQDSSTHTNNPSGLANQAEPVSVLADPLNAAPAIDEPISATVTPTKVTVGDVVVLDEPLVLNAAQPVNVIQHPEAGFIKLHFQHVRLQQGEIMVMRDKDGLEVARYPQDIPHEGVEAFWALSVLSDELTLEVQHHDGNISANSQVIIDQYSYGLTPEELYLLSGRNNNPSAPNQESLCGAKDYRDVMCYEDSHPVEFSMSTPVVRLLLKNGRSSCTGWRVGPTNNTIMTNEHCIANQAELDATEVWFNYQRTGCDTGTSRNHLAVVRPDKLLSVDAGLDYALFTIHNPERVTEFGAYELDPRVPARGEKIYIPQHPSSQPKKLSIYSDLNNGLCQVDNPDRRNVEIGYLCDTEPGSSGSPVLSAETDKVIALHHTGGCTNNGVRIEKIWPHIEDFLQPVDPTIPPRANDGEIVNFADVNFTRFSSNNANDASNMISNNGNKIVLEHNLWLRSAQIYTITPDTVIEFDFSSNARGEIHGIGFDSDDTASQDRIFQLSGTQDWGISDFDYAGGNQHYVIPVGQYYAGEMRMILVNDHDAGSDNQTTIGNLRICEGACPEPSQFSDFSSLGFNLFSANNADNATHDIFDDGRKISLEHNVWLRSDTAFDISENTILSVDVYADGTGEIQGIGFDEDDTASSDRIFKLIGTQEWGIQDIQYGSGWQHVEIPVGQYFQGHMHLILVNDNDNGSNNQIEMANLRLCDGPCNSGDQTPYFGVPQNILGTLYAQHFDLGGQGVAYNDSDQTNNGGDFRSQESVDLQVASIGEYNIGWLTTGEWFEYTVVVPATGSYNFQFRVASLERGGRFHLEIDGQMIGSQVSFDATDGWQNWATVDLRGVQLSAGVQVIRFVADSAQFNWHSINVTR